MKFDSVDFMHLVRASYPLVGVRTAEELLIKENIYGLAQDNNRLMGRWTSAGSLQFYSDRAKVKVGKEEETTQKGPVVIKDTATFQDMLKTLVGTDLTTFADAGRSSKEGICRRYDGAIILVHDFWSDLNTTVTGVRSTRLLLEVLEHLTHTCTMLVLIGPDRQFEGLPDLLKTRITMLDLPLPDYAAREESLVYIVDSMLSDKDKGEEPAHIDDAVKVDILEAGAGMTKLQFEDALSLAITKCPSDHKQLTKDAVATVFQKKIAHIEDSGLLQYIPATQSFNRVQGMQVVKAWSAVQRASMTAEAREARIKRPKGCCAFGPPGTGKTMLCEAIALEFGWPLFSLDPGRLMSPYVGQTEALTRQAIQLIDSLGPCVIKIDEAEKFFNKVALEGHNASPSSQKSFATLLSWMQDRTSQAYLIMTSNNVLMMPPALYRKGRWDEVWWVDLPDNEARRAIIEHALIDDLLLQVPTSAELQKLTLKTENFSGAEIDALVHDSYRHVWSEQKSQKKKVTPAAMIDLTTQKLSSLVGGYTPQSQFATAEYEEMRKLVVRYFRPANPSATKVFTELKSGDKATSSGRLTRPLAGAGPEGSPSAN